MLSVNSLFSGVLFGFGLALSGMVNPSKIIGFLDISGNWDPSLIFVMAGGVLVTIISFRFLLNRPTPIFGGKLVLPTKQDIDTPLLAGAGIFGIGWALGGFCPGPALSALAYGNEKVFIFVGAMIVGIAVAKIGLRSLRLA